MDEKEFKKIFYEQFAIPANWSFWPFNQTDVDHIHAHRKKVRTYITSTHKSKEFASSKKLTINFLEAAHARYLGLIADCELKIIEDPDNARIYSAIKAYLMKMDANLLMSKAMYEIVVTPKIKPNQPAIGLYLQLSGKVVKGGRSAFDDIAKNFDFRSGREIQRAYENYKNYRVLFAKVDEAKVIKTYLSHLKMAIQLLTENDEDLTEAVELQVLLLNK